MKSYKFPSVKKIWGIRNIKFEKKVTKKFWKKSNRKFAKKFETFQNVVIHWEMQRKYFVGKSFHNNT